MSSVLSKADAAPMAAAWVACDQADQEPISTPEAAALMGFSEATLRNYNWLNSLSSEERAMRKLRAALEEIP